MRLQTSDAPDGEGGNKWQLTGINDGAADPYCPGSRRSPSVLTRGPRPSLFGSPIDVDTAILDELAGDQRHNLLTVATIGAIVLPEGDTKAVPARFESGGFPDGR
jgi:hypothetical protein